MRTGIVLLAICLSSLAGYCQPDRIIRADLNSIKGSKSTAFNECVGAGRANEGLRADWQEQLAVVQKAAGFRYIRFHGLLHDDMGVYSLDKSGKAVYNFQYIDRLFDYLLRSHVKPFVEFSFMPADLASGTKTIFWWKANVTKPKSYTEWDNLIRALVVHWQKRYGQKEIGSWYYEVWNEPDLSGFYEGTQLDYFELYAHTATAVRSVNGSLRVGGPATSATKWIADFLAYCDRRKLPLDFISTHDYGTTSSLDEFGTKKQALKSNQDTISLNVKRVRSLLEASAFKNAELHFTEWNTSPSSRDPIHDTYQNAAYILNALKNIGNYCNSVSYWTFTDIFEEAGPGKTPFHGGFGLMTLQGIRKPTFYVYKFLNELGPTEIECSDKQAIICKSAEGAQVLLWNYKHPGGNYKFDQDYFSTVQPPQGKQSVEINLSHLSSGSYQIKVFRVGYKQNDAFTSWIEMGRPADLQPAEVTKLKGLSDGHPSSTSTFTSPAGNYKVALPLNDNEICFVTLTRTYQK